MGKIFKALKFILMLIYLSILYIIPYADLDVAGILAGSVFGNLGKIPVIGVMFRAQAKMLTIFPMVEPIYISKLSNAQKLMLAVLVLIPYIDLEGIRIIEKLGRTQFKFFQFSSRAGKIAKKGGKMAAHHSDEIAREGRKELLRHGGTEHKDGRVMTDGGQDTGQASSSSSSLSFSMPFGSSSNTFKIEKSMGSGTPGEEAQKDQEVTVKYNEDSDTLEGTNGDLSVGAWYVTDTGQSIYVEKSGGNFKPSPRSRQAVKEAAGIDTSPSAATDGGTSGGTSGGFGGSGGGGGGSVGSGIDEGTAKKALAGVAVIGVIGFLAVSGWGQQLSSQGQLSSVGLDFDSQARQVQGLLKQVQCFGSAACYRQWQMNNTQRPGSEEVGERYQLMIENFDVNDGYRLDVNRRTAQTTVPVGFSVYNPRNGLKGVTARDVKYRVAILGPESDSSNPICTTQAENSDSEWIDLGGQFSDKNNILPGGFATPTQSLDTLNLGNCGLLQPALGINRKVELQVKYDYSSQATLYVDAMSWENLRSLGERPSFKKSETADTPVQSYINVESPVVYRAENGQRTSDQFQVKIGFETDENNLMYRIHPDSINFYDSSETVDVGSSRCELSGGSSDQYSINSETRQYYEDRADVDDPTTWFDSVSGPSPIRCTMKLEQPIDISPTGETLTMRVDGNYTVVFEEEFTEFEAVNSACEDIGQYNCPLLVTPSEKSESDYDNLMTTCDSDNTVDAGNGCDIRALDGEWSQITGPINAKPIDTDIEEGEQAMTWQGFLNRWTDKASDTHVLKNGDVLEGRYTDGNCANGCPDKSAFGLPMDEKESFQNHENGYGYLAVARDGEDGGGDVKIEQMEKTTAICTDSLSGTSNDDAVERYVSYHAESDISNFQSVLYAQMKAGNCEAQSFIEKVKEQIDEWNPWADTYEDKRSSCGGFMVIENGEARCFNQ